jgi:proteasome assembly chaperone (PAC2) family protein
LRFFSASSICLFQVPKPFNGFWIALLTGVVVSGIPGVGTIGELLIISFMVSRWKLFRSLR